MSQGVPFALLMILVAMAWRFALPVLRRLIDSHLDLMRTLGESSQSMAGSMNKLSEQMAGAESRLRRIELALTSMERMMASNHVATPPGESKG